MFKADNVTFEDYKRDILVDNAASMRLAEGVVLDLGYPKEANDSENILLPEHAMLIGGVGSGKTNLVRFILSSVLSRYEPNELIVSVIDGKGCEFQGYRASHEAASQIKTIADGRDDEQIMKLLTSVVELIDVRQSVLYTLGATCYESYLRDLYLERNTPSVQETECVTPQALQATLKNSDGKITTKYSTPMPRLLLVFDELEASIMELEASEQGLVLSTLYSILKLGKAVGVHVLATAHSYGGCSLPLLELFKYRVALRCSRECSLHFLGEDTASEIEANHFCVSKNMDTRLGAESKTWRIPFTEESRLSSLM